MKANPTKLLILTAMLAAGPSALHAQWTNAATGTGVSTQERNYLTTTNWDSGIIDDTFSSLPSATTTLYFNGSRTTSGAAGISITNLGPFNQSLLLGANGLNLTQSGALTLQGGGTFNSVPAATHTLTLGGDVVVNGAANLTLGSTGATAGLNIDLGNATRTFYSGSGRTLTVVNPVTNGSLVHQGPGGVILQGANTISNVVVGRNSKVIGTQFSLQQAGTLTSTSDILVLSGSIFRINNQSSAAISRLNSSGSVTLSTGRFINNFSANTGGRSYSETLGQLVLNAGNSIYEQGAEANNANTNTITTNLGDIVRQNSGLLTLRNGVQAASPASGVVGLGTAGNTAFINNLAALETAGLYVGGTGGAGTTTQKIFTFITGQSGILSSLTTYDTLYTYDNSTGLRPLNLTTEFATALGGNVTDNVRLTSATVVASSQTANSLVLNNSLTINSGQTLSITSGVISNVSSSNISGPGTLAFGSREGIYSTGGTNTVSANITGSGGLTISGAFSATTLSGNNSGLTGRINLLSRTGGTTAAFQANSNNALGTSNALLLGSDVGLTIGQSGAITSRVTSLVGGTYPRSGRVALNDASDAFVIGNGLATAGTLVIDGASATTFIAPGMPEGSAETRIGILELNGGAAIARNGDFRIDLFSKPITMGSLAEGYSDLILAGTSFDLANAGDLRLSINLLNGLTMPAIEGTSWVIAVAGGSAGMNTLTNSNGGSLFDFVTSGFEVSIGDFGTGTNNALILTAIPEPSTALLLGGVGLFYALVRRRRTSVAKS